MMKIIQILLLFATLSIYSQFNYSEGYFILMNNQKVEVKFKNKSWGCLTKTLKYKTNDGKKESISVNDLKEFYISGGDKFIRALVDYDSSSDSPQYMENIEDIRTIPTDLLLKVIVDGKNSLYKYKNGKVNKYFYRCENCKLIKPLKHKYYYKGLIGDLSFRIRENKAYINQLKEIYKCDSNEELFIPGYNEDDLAAFFNKINTCL